MRVVNLASGSKGNSTYIEGANVKVLLDIGLTMPVLTERMEKVGLRPNDIDAIVITHEHGDHIKGLVSFMKKYKARAYIPSECIKSLGELPSLISDRIIEVKGYSFKIGDLIVMPFKLPHDSAVCYGYTFIENEKKVSFATDLGYMSEVALCMLEGSNLVYIESNYDRKKLLNCPYPYIVKQRIMSERGHLSNEQCSEAIVHLARNGTKYFVLSHLSENSNTMELAYLASAKALENAGFTLEKDVFLRYSRQDKPGNNFYFS